MLIGQATLGPEVNAGKRMLEAASRSHDDSVLFAATRGDERAFAELHERHSRAIYNYVLRSVRDYHLAEDVTQNIWLTVHKQLHKLREHTCFQTWLYRIAERACVDTARGRAVSAIVPVEAGEHPTAPETDPGNLVVRKEHARLAWQALGALSARQHSALFLKVVEARSYREIAETLNTSEDAVGDLLFRARRRMADEYRRLGRDPDLRCRLAQQVMVAVVDNEATPVRATALRAHLKDCRSCRTELAALKAASRRYAGLLLLPVPAAVAHRIFDAARLGSLSNAATSAVKLVATGFVKVNVVAVVMATTTVATVVFAAPSSESVSAPVSQVTRNSDEAGDSRPLAATSNPNVQGLRWTLADSSKHLPVRTVEVPQVGELSAPGQIVEGLVDQATTLVQTEIGSGLAIVDQAVAQTVDQVVAACNELLQQTDAVTGSVQALDECPDPANQVSELQVPEVLDLPLPTPPIPLMPTATPAVPNVPLDVPLLP